MFNFFLRQLRAKVSTKIPDFLGVRCLDITTDKNAMGSLSDYFGYRLCAQQFEEFQKKFRSGELHPLEAIDNPVDCDQPIPQSLFYSESFEKGCAYWNSHSDAEANGVPAVMRYVDSGEIYMITESHRYQGGDVIILPLVDFHLFISNYASHVAPVKDPLTDDTAKLSNAVESWVEKSLGALFDPTPYLMYCDEEGQTPIADDDDYDRLRREVWENTPPCVTLPSSVVERINGYAFPRHRVRKTMTTRYHVDAEWRPQQHNWVDQNEHDLRTLGDPGCACVNCANDKIAIRRIMRISGHDPTGGCKVLEVHGSKPNYDYRRKLERVFGYSKIHIDRMKEFRAGINLVRDPNTNDRCLNFPVFVPRIVQSLFRSCLTDDKNEIDPTGRFACVQDRLKLIKTYVIRFREIVASHVSCRPNAEVDVVPLFLHPLFLLVGAEDTEMYAHRFASRETARVKQFGLPGEVISLGVAKHKHPISLMAPPSPLWAAEGKLVPAQPYDVERYMSSVGRNSSRTQLSRGVIVYTGPVLCHLELKDRDLVLVVPEAWAPVTTAHLANHCGVDAAKTEARTPIHDSPIIDWVFQRVEQTIVQQCASELYVV